MAVHPYPILEIPSSNKPAASPSISGYWTVRSLSSKLTPRHNNDITAGENSHWYVKSGK